MTEQSSESQPEDGLEPADSQPPLSKSEWLVRRERELHDWRDDQMGELLTPPPNAEHADQLLGLSADHPAMQEAHERLAKQRADLARDRIASIRDELPSAAQDSHDRLSALAADESKAPAELQDQLLQEWQTQFPSFDLAPRQSNNHAQAQTQAPSRPKWTPAEYATGKAAAMWMFNKLANRRDKRAERRPTPTGPGRNTIKRAGQVVTGAGLAALASKFLNIDTVAGVVGNRAGAANNLANAYGSQPNVTKEGSPLPTQGGDSLRQWLGRREARRRGRGQRPQPPEKNP